MSSLEGVQKRRLSRGQQASLDLNLLSPGQVVLPSTFQRGNSLPRVFDLLLHTVGSQLFVGFFDRGIGLKLWN